MLFPKYWFFLLVLLLMPLLASAQASTDRPPPSAAGGLVGGPGMAGAALPNESATPEPLPTHPPDSSVGALHGEVPHGDTPPPISPDQVNISNDPMMVGLDALSEDSSGQRGSLALVVLPAEVFANFRSSVQAGGFGAPVQGRPVLPPISFSFTLPNSIAPIPLGDFSTITSAEQAAQTAVAAAIAQSSPQTDQAASAATQQAQQAYDQFWSAYYASVSAASQQYYDTVMQLDGVDAADLSAGSDAGQHTYRLCQRLCCPLHRLLYVLSLGLLHLSL